MRILLVNPIFLTFACLAGLIIVVVWILGGNLGEAATSVLTPYLFDIHRGFGTDSELLIKAIPAVAQLTMLVLIFVLARVKNKYARISVTVFGVTLVVSYFAFLTMVQFISSIH